MAGDPPGADEAGAPPSVRLIRGAVARLRTHPGRLAAVLCLTGLAGWLATGVSVVDNGESGARLRFGRLVEDTLQPGLHLSLPAGVDHIQRVRTGEVLRLEVIGDDGAPIPLVTGDENLIETTLVVQYKITSLGPYLYRSEAPADLLRHAVRTSLVDTVARMPVDDVLTGGKARIQNEVRREAQARLQAWGAGLSLVAVHLQAVNPPPEATDAFRQVSDARAQAARAVNEAESAGERGITLAQGEAAGLRQEASSWAMTRTQQARGAAARFQQVLAQSRRTPGQTRTDFYLETIRKVFPKTRIIILAPGEKPRVDVNLMPPE